MIRISCLCPENNDKSMKNLRILLLNFRKMSDWPLQKSSDFLRNSCEKNSFVFRWETDLVGNCLYWTFYRNLPDPYTASFFLVKGKMNPTLTHNKLYLLSHDELINPVKTIKSKTLKTKIYEQFQSRSSSENKTAQQSGQVEGLLKSSSYLRWISLQSNSIHVTSTLFHNNALSRVHTGGEERSWWHARTWHRI